MIAFCFLTIEQQTEQYTQSITFQRIIKFIRQNLFNQPLKNCLRTYDNIRKIATGQGDDCTTSSLLDHFEIIAINLTKQEALDAEPKSIQQINFTENIHWVDNVNANNINEMQCFSLLKKRKKPFTKNWESILILFCVNTIAV